MGDNMKRAPLGELENEVYSLLRKKEKASVRDICDELQNSRKYTTIMTVMNRMVIKGDLFREKSGACYLYWINKKQSKKLAPILAQLKEKLFKGNTSEMVSYLLEEDTNITEDELSEIEKLIKEMKSK